MEQLNKVILRGIIGSVRIINVEDRKGARMTVATNLAYRGQDGCCIIETTWHNVKAWEGQGIHDLDILCKGDRVEVTGRIKNQRYTTSDGEYRYSTEILAHTVNLLTDPLTMEE